MQSQKIRERERPLSQLGLSLFLIIYTASIPTRLPRYVAPSLSRLQLGRESPGGFLRQNVRPPQSLKTVREAACRSNFRPFIKVLLSFFIRSPLSLFLSPFLSFIPGLSHTTTQTAASSHLLTDADAETAAAAAVGYYERAAFNTNYSSPVWIHLESLHICLVCGAGQCTMTKLPL